MPAAVAGCKKDRDNEKNHQATEAMPTLWAKASRVFMTSGETGMPHKRLRLAPICWARILLTYKPRVPHTQRT